MNEVRVRGSVWSVTAAALVVAAVTALVVVLTDPYTRADSARLFARGKVLARLAAASGVLAGAAALVRIWDVWTENVEINLFQQAATSLWIVAVLCCLLVPVLEHYRARSLDPQASEACA